MSKKAVLAFSGGLDTSFCALYLKKELGMEVHAVLVNTGGFEKYEIDSIEDRAYELGAASFTCLDETDHFYNHFIKYLVFGNVLKNNTYPLSVSAERSVQATAIAYFAKKINADIVAHGSTGAGNDQVRFDLVFHTLIPEIKILTPIRDLQISREEEIKYLQKERIHIDKEKSKYSINKGLWGTSVGGVETQTSHQSLPESAWPSPVTKKHAKKILLHFEKGEFTGINYFLHKKPVDAILALHEQVKGFGIGRDIHVGDTIVGIKGRVGFEAAAPMMIIKAHHALEKHVLTKWQLFLKNQLSDWYGNWMHEGQYHDPVMRNIEKFLADTQEYVSGKVFIEMAPYRFSIEGIESTHDLMSASFGSYGEMNRAWSGDDVKGFTKIQGMSGRIFHLVNQEISDE